MGEPGFWDNPEKDQQTINQIKPLAGMLKPYEELEEAAGEVRTLLELADEDPSLETEREAELPKFEKRLGEFELRSMLSGSQDGSYAYLLIQSGMPRTDAGDWDQRMQGKQ